MKVFAVVAALAASAATAQVYTCAFNKTTTACPIAGQPCTEKQLCAKGLYCKASRVGEDGNSYTGVCSNTPDITDVYAKPCSLGNDVPECVYNNPLALSPRSPPSALRCIRAFDTDTAGTCRIGPNKHGDACNQDNECASGKCLRELRLCKGIDEGEHCSPSLPDPCQPGHYCLPDSGSSTGRCAKVVSAGAKCAASQACERGFFCAGPDVTNRRCIAPFTVPDGTNTTIGPYMCASANALLAVGRSDIADSVYTCLPSNATLVGTRCNPAAKAPLGYECVCSGANNGEYRLRSINALGLGGRSNVWRELMTCLNTATGIMGDLCEFDSVDLEIVRYGSCAYYGCHPQYLRLVNATGGRSFRPPLLQFERFATCEIEAATAYYASVFKTDCLSLPNLDNWKCAVDAGPLSLSVTNTGGVIAFIFLVVGFAYWGHMYAFRKVNGQKLPFVSN